MTIETIEQSAALRKALYALGDASVDYEMDARLGYEAAPKAEIDADLKLLDALAVQIVALSRSVETTCRELNFTEARPKAVKVAAGILEALDDLYLPATKVIDAAIDVELLK